MRRPPVVLGMAVITALALIVAVALIVFQVNPQQDETQSGLKQQQMELAQQIKNINAIICSQAQVYANAYRFRTLTPSGNVEPVRHFLTRMQAQRQTLELSQGRDCPVAPGFPPFEFQLERALQQIERILSSFSAQQRKPVERNLESESGDLQGTPNQLQGSPEFGFGVPSFPTPKQPNGQHVGVGEDGVPYVPKKPKAPKHVPAPESEATPAKEHEQKTAPSETPEAESPQSQESPNPPAAAGTKPPVKEVIEGAEGALGNTFEGLCTAIREVNGLC